ncbi:MAG TPA: DUF1553 domain-containing protein [Gemmatales bacterium]|nr:DUF1553 domain-containing protein [Gemmatales bacterium]
MIHYCCFRIDYAAAVCHHDLLLECYPPIVTTLLICMPTSFLPLLLLTVAGLTGAAWVPVAEDTKPTIDFTQQIAPIFQKHCYQCHGPEKQKNGLRLDQREAALKGGDLGQAIVPGQSSKSPLYRYIAGLEPDSIMPPKGPRLTKDEVALIQKWIDEGAKWPETTTSKETWWSFKSLASVTAPTLSAESKKWARTPVDVFIWDALQKKQLQPSLEANRRTLIRRLKYDLLGLPPTPEEVDAFTKDADPLAYEKLVDRYLASDRYGERWARHWLDVVHYGETHGYDKDQPRPNAWPYRDYVIRAFNNDKPYARFVEEQLAGDVLYPDIRDGNEALGFISAGPWDLIGHAELPETKIDGKIARHLDRDDMVANTINTFQSITVHCAQCHNHKFDPIPSEDYYRLQAVFAAVDRADKQYDLDPLVGKQRKKWREQLNRQQDALTALKEKRLKLSSPELLQVTKKMDGQKKVQANTNPEYGYHSQLASKATTEKWVQIDLHELIDISRIEVVGCYDDFNNIGAGFGFPRRYRITASANADMKDAVVLVDHAQTVQDNPGTLPLTFASDTKARYVRVTALELAPRLNDYMFALAEVRVFDRTGANRALKSTVTALDSIEAPSRWAKTNLVDGIAPKPVDLKRQHELKRKYDELHALLIPASLMAEIRDAETALESIQAEIKKLPAPLTVYAGTVHYGTGNFIGTGKLSGKPRPIFLLQRGNVQKPMREMEPGTLSLLKQLPGKFEISKEAGEGERRAALAKWITSQDNPLTWRSIVNRVWQYHFGQGLVETPNDFGRMGQLPSHPELLDWLANDFRQHGSFKKLHRLLVTSAVYRQSSQPTSKQGQTVDSNNRLLWHMNRRRLEAEALRDSILQTAGKLDLTMGGPSYQDYIVEKPEHSPHYRYELKDPNDPKQYRRSIYRSIVRSQQNPWMATMDCADPSILVEKRTQTTSPLQALALLNDPLLLVMSKNLADRVKMEPQPIVSAMQLILQRQPTLEEQAMLTGYAQKHGMEQLGRLLWNLNEFTFID